MDGRAEKKYWFPTKRYGWGWGLPSAWQGWLVLLVFVVLLGGGFFLLPAAGFGVYVALLVVGLCGVCWLKGEPPRWRWGGE